MAKSYLISKPNSGTLVLTKSRGHSLYSLIGAIGFWVVWYGVQIAMHKGVANLIEKVIALDWFTILFVAAPLLSFPELFKSIKNVFLPRVFTFDAVSKRISDKGVMCASFDEVASVQIKTVKDSDGPDEYALSIRLKSERKIRIDQGKNYEEIFEIADEIAELLKVSVEKTG